MGARMWEEFGARRAAEMEAELGIATRAAGVWRALAARLQDAWDRLEQQRGLDPQAGDAHVEHNEG